MAISFADSLNCIGAGCVVVAVLTATGAAHAASETVLYSFKDHGDGGHSTAALINVNGRLYGTVPGGDRSRNGNVFSVTKAGDLKIVYSFRGKKYGDGSRPAAGLINVSGTLYGTTTDGGQPHKCHSGCGTVFKVTLAGVETVVYRFEDGGDGAYPFADLINVGGTLYGTTWGGGGSTNCGSDGCGTVFKVTKAGAEKVVYSFGGGNDGAHPAAGLINVGGTLYGTTTDGGGSANCGGDGCGTAFRVTKAGAEKVIYSFTGANDGAYPAADLINIGGALYGTTANGGASGFGTVFKVTKEGAETVLHSFGETPDGASPYAGLVKVGGTLYGTTSQGGGSGLGTVFRVTKEGAEMVIYSFVGTPDASYPAATLISVGDTLYSTSFEGGAASDGTVFAMTP